MKRASMTLFAALAAASALAAPVLAQPYGTQPYGPPPPAQGGYDQDHDRRDHDHDHEHGPMQPGGWDIDRRIDWMQQRIMRGRSDGSLDRREYRHAQRQLDSIKNDYRRARWHGGGRLDDRARDMLQERLDRLNGEIHWLRDNGDRRPW